VSLFVEAARIYALAHGIEATSTRARLQGYAAAVGVGEAESDGWVEGFDFLQYLRLRAQIGPDRQALGPNQIEVRSLSDIDRRILKEAFRMARRLQQRLELDYLR
jgi:CBS domain-containing protein